MLTTELTVGDLLDYVRDLPDDTPVRLAQQPAWPFENHLGEPLVMETDDGDVVYLPEGGQVGYLPGDVASELGWR
jgi:hypothetical protein